MSKAAGDCSNVVKRSTRSRAPSVRKCCACECQQGTQEPLNVGRKRTSVKHNKNAAHADKPIKARPDVLPSVARAKFVVQLRPDAAKHKVKKSETVSAEASAVLEEEGTNELQDTTGDVKIAQASQTRRIMKRPALPPNNSTTLTSATPRQILRKKADPVPPHVNKANPSISKLETPAVRKREPAKNFDQYFEDIGCGYHITWDGFDEPAEYRIGEVCGFCEADLVVAPGDNYNKAEFSTLPVVAMLPCGHAFHADCLDQAELGIDQGDPSCVLCESNM
ncbi:hypothetical protein vseg_000637 [Gypsophila vaccaria]